MPRRIGYHWPAFLLAAVLLAVTYAASTQFAPSVASRSTVDRWFDADTGRVFSAMTDLNGDHYRSAVHPLFLPLTYPWVRLAHEALHLDLLTVVRLAGAVTAAVWGLLLYALHRSQGYSRPGACLWVALSGSTAAALCWLTVPETYALGSVSLLLPLVLLSRDTPLFRRFWVWSAATTLALGITLTNVLPGVFVSALAQGVRRALQLLAVALIITGAVWAVMREIAPFVPPPRVIFAERHYVGLADAGGPVAVTRAFLARGVVLTRPSVIWSGKLGGAHPHQLLSVQRQPLAQTPVEGACLLLWAGVLSVGASQALRRARAGDPLALALLAVAAGQWLLHLLYGAETFLYALHYTPILVLLASYAGRSRFQRQATLAALVLVPLLLANNLPIWLECVRWFNTG